MRTISFIFSFAMGLFVIFICYLVSFRLIVKRLKIKKMDLAVGVRMVSTSLALLFYNAFANIMDKLYSVKLPWLNSDALFLFVILFGGLGLGIIIDKSLVHNKV